MEGETPRTPEMRRSQLTSTPIRGDLAPPFSVPGATKEARSEPPTGSETVPEKTAPPATEKEIPPASAEEAKKTPAKEPNAVGEPPKKKDQMESAPGPSGERHQQGSESPSRRKGASKANKVEDNSVQN